MSENALPYYNIRTVELWSNLWRVMKTSSLSQPRLVTSCYLPPTQGHLWLSFTLPIGLSASASLADHCIGFHRACCELHSEEHIKHVLSIPRQLWACSCRWVGYIDLICALSIHVSAVSVFVGVELHVTVLYRRCLMITCNCGVMRRFLGYSPIVTCQKAQVEDAQAASDFDAVNICTLSTQVPIFSNK